MSGARWGVRDRGVWGQGGGIRDTVGVFGCQGAGWGIRNGVGVCRGGWDVRGWDVAFCPPPTEDRSSACPTAVVTQTSLSASGNKPETERASVPAELRAGVLQGTHGLSPLENLTGDGTVT